MEEPSQLLKSQTELIIEKFFANLELHSEFDKETLDSIKEIAKSGKLTKNKLIEQAINAFSGGKDEDS